MSGTVDEARAIAARPVAASGLKVLWLIPLALLPLPFFLNEYHQYVVNLILVYIPVGIGFNVVVGNLGLLAFSNVAFFGIGAYTAGVLLVRPGVAWGGAG